jgi:hypothetical protein
MYCILCVIVLLCYVMCIMCIVCIVCIMCMAEVVCVCVCVCVYVYVYVICPYPLCRSSSYNRLQLGGVRIRKTIKGKHVISKKTSQRR